MRRLVVALAVMNLVIVGLACGDTMVWAEGASDNGNQSWGSGQGVPECLSPGMVGYSPIHQPTCGDSGKDGGGKSWRIYKVKSDTTTMDKLNVGATWKAVEGYEFGLKGITGANGILTICAKKGSPYIVLFGLNGINNSKFYVSLNREKERDPITGRPTNRGDYYNWNLYNAITNVNQLSNADSLENGRIITHGLAKTLYVKEFGPTSDNVFDSVGAFCTWGKDEFTLTAYAKDKGSGAVLNNGKPIDSVKVDSGESATVKNKAFAGYSFLSWTGGSTSPSYTIRSLTSNQTVYAFYAKRFTLTAYAKEKGSGAALNNGEPIDSVTVNDGESATVKNKAFDGYSFVSWTGGSTSSSYIVRSLTSNQTVDAFYERNTFEGQAIASSGTKVTQNNTYASVGYNTTGGTKTGYIKNCSSTAGCNVYFTHNLRRTAGSGSTEYSISRTSNLTSKVSAGTVKSTTTWSGSPTQLSQTGPHKLYPGMVVCETLTFKPYNDSSAKNVDSKVCVIALGYAQPLDPDNPNGNQSLIYMNVLNANVTAYSNYMKEVYAKPGDKLSYKGEYNPILQYTYNLKPQWVQIGDGKINKGENNTLGAIFNTYKESGLFNWNNGFTIQYGLRKNDKDGFSNLTPPYYKYTAGNTSSRTSVNRRTVQGTDVGNSMDERISTEDHSAIMTTPTQVKFEKYNSDEVLGRVFPDGLSEIVYARIPYNFNITAELTSKDGTSEDGVLFAGEDASIGYKINVEKKPNSLTTNNHDDSDAYATKADNVKRGLVIYSDSSNLITVSSEAKRNGGIMSESGRDANPCAFFTNVLDNTSVCMLSAIKEDDTLQPGESLKSDEYFTVEDVPAGTRICVAAAVFPASSGADTNWNDLNYSNSWRISGSKCFTVAKSPSIQVWGGNVYSGGKIITGISKKKHLAGYRDYATDMGNMPPYVFGSWGELGVIATGEVRGFASGASLGYLTNNEGQLQPNPLFNDSNTRIGNYPGGFFDNAGYSYCKLTPLSIANKDCSRGTSGSVGTANAIEGINGDKEKLQSLANALGVGQMTEVSEINDLGSSSTFYNSSNTITVNGGTIPGNQTILIHAGDNITINGNITYSDTGYTGLLETPKLIIYSDKNIIINCDVNRIDAVLMADTVNTCETVNNNHDTPQSANQLTIYGAILANKLEANRTYGAATGVNSMVPAEIIDFDATLYLWKGLNDGSESGDGEGGETDYNDMDTVYTKELAPRY